MDFWGSLANFWRTSGEPLNSTVRKVPGKAPGNFKGSPGKSRNFPEGLGKSDSLPALCKLWFYAHIEVVNLQPLQHAVHAIIVNDCRVVYAAPKCY